MGIDHTELVVPVITSLSTAIIDALFMRKNTENAEFEKLKAGKFNEVMNQLIDEGKMSYLDYYHCHNYLQVAKIADAELKKKNTSDYAGKENASYNHLDFDWYVRFFTDVGNISDHDMQILWGRMLAGQIESGNKYSLRTMETLTNMTSSEARLYKDISGLVLHSTSPDRYFFFIEDEFYTTGVNEEYGLTDDVMNKLVDCNLVNLQVVQAFEDILSGQSVFVNGDMAVLLERKTRKKKFSLYQSYPLTEAGVQILNLIDREPNYEYTKSVANYLLNKGNQLMVSVKHIHSCSEDEENYTLELGDDIDF